VIGRIILPLALHRHPKRVANQSDPLKPKTLLNGQKFGGEG